MAFIQPPSASHSGIRVALLPLGNTTQDAFAQYTWALLGAGAHELSLSDISDLSVEIPSFMPALPVASGVLNIDLSLEMPPDVPSDLDAEMLYPNRSLVRAWMGVCDGRAHDCVSGGARELVGVIKAFNAEVARRHAVHGPQNWPEPIVRVLVFSPSEAQMEESAAVFGPRVRFITHALDGADPALGMHLKLTMNELGADLLRALDAEVGAFTRLVDDTSSLSVAPQEANPASATLPPAIMGRRSGGLELGLFAGIGGFSLALGSAKRRLAGRLQKHRADVFLMCGSPVDALDAAERAVRLAKGNGDSLFAGLAEETRASAIVGRYALDNGMSRMSAPILPEVALCLRDCVTLFDAAAGQPELGAHADLVAQLCIAARIRLVRYLGAAAPARAIDSICQVVNAPDDALLGWWEKTRISGAQQWMDPRSANDASILASERRKCHGASIVHRAIAAGFAGVSATAPSPAAASGIIMSQESGVISSLLSGAGRSAMTVYTPSGSLEIKGLSTADILEALSSAMTRTKDVRVLGTLVRLLLALADTYELVGLPKKADAAAWRACRALRAMQPPLPPERFAAHRRRAEAEPPTVAGCVYCATKRDGSSAVPLERAPIVCGSVVAWPYPWLGAVPGNESQSGFITQHRFPPALAAAAVSLGCAARDPTMQALLLNDPSLLPAASAAARSRGRALGARVVLPAASAVEWLPLIAADCWQSGELLVALAAMAACTACDTLGNAIVRMPASTAGLRDCETPVRAASPSSSPAASTAEGPALTMPAASRGESTPRSIGIASVASPTSRFMQDSATLQSAIDSGSSVVMSAMLKFRNRRYLCATAASALLCGGPLAVLRAFLTGGVIPHALTTLDALLTLKLLASCHLSAVATARHRTRHAADAPMHDASPPVVDASSAELSPCRPGRGLIDVLLADACCGAFRDAHIPAAGAEQLLKQLGLSIHTPAPRMHAISDGKLRLNVGLDAVGLDLGSAEGVYPDDDGDDVVDDGAMRVSGGGVDRSPPPTEWDDSTPGEAASFVAWRPFVLFHQLAAYIGASGEHLCAGVSQGPQECALTVQLRHPGSIMPTPRGPVMEAPVLPSSVIERHLTASLLPLRSPVIERIAWRIGVARDTAQTLLVLEPARPNAALLDPATAAGSAVLSHISSVLAQHELVLVRAQGDAAPRSIRESITASMGCPGASLHRASAVARTNIAVDAAAGLHIRMRLRNPVAAAVEGAVVLRLRLSSTKVASQTESDYVGPSTASEAPAALPAEDPPRSATYFTVPVHFALLPQSQTDVDVPLPRQFSSCPGLTMTLAEVWVMVGSLFQILPVRVASDPAARRLPGDAGDVLADICILPPRATQTGTDESSAFMRSAQISTPLHAASPVGGGPEPARIPIDALRIAGFVPVRGISQQPLPKSVAVYGTAWQM